MSTTSKTTSLLNGDNILRSAFNEEDKSLTTASFVSAKLGHKITRSIISATVDDFEYYDATTLLYTIRVTYTDSTHSDLVSVERTV